MATHIVYIENAPENASIIDDAGTALQARGKPLVRPPRKARRPKSRNEHRLGVLCCVDTFVHVQVRLIGVAPSDQRLFPVAALAPPTVSSFE